VGGCMRFAAQNRLFTDAPAPVSADF